LLFLRIVKSLRGFGLESTPKDQAGERAGGYVAETRVACPVADPRAVPNTKSVRN
jgi:hypothetical protein